MQYLVLGGQWLLAAVFLVGAGSKLTRPAYREFVASTGRLLPTRWSGWRRPAAAVVLAAEVAAVGLLVWPATAPVGFGLALALGAAFSAGVTGALRRGERAPCRCFGASATPLGRTHLVRNAVVVAVAVIGLALVALGPPASVHPAGAAVAILLGLVLAGLVVRMDDLVALFTPISM